MKLPTSFKPSGIEDWTRSDVYHNSFLLPHDEGFVAANRNSDANGLPEIAVSAAQGKFLSLLARSIGAKRILEVGTLGGFSAIWFAKALPDDGKLVTLEISEKHASVARENINNAGYGDKVEIILGSATETIKNLKPDVPFDLAFIDADKVSNKLYFIEAKKVLRKGGLIVVDNVVRNGRVSDPAERDENSEGVRELLKYIQNDKEVDATTVGMAGEKGYDGMLFAYKV